MSGLAEPSTARGAAETKLSYLPSLDGVRALAVGAVMVYHLDIGLLSGGFLGVDLFFVLSGFLITTLLMREYAARRTIDLAQFWLRRARRLLPALFLVIGAIAVAASAASPFDRETLRWDILSSLAYVTNWRFIAEGQSYFQEFAAPSPILHLWSLAIEEQFYVIWPLLALGGLSLAAGRRWGERGAIWLLLAGISGSVIALGLTWDEADPSAAYYATHTRAHELLVGALAAFVLERRPAVLALARRWAGLAGPASLGMLLAYAVLLDDASALYYFGGSLAFAVAAAVLISSLAVGMGRRSDVVGRTLSLRPLPWVGAISYGLYLWHWPLILWITPATTGLQGPALALVRVAATFLVSAASFYLVERPIRRGSIGPIRLRVPQVASGALAAVVLLSGITLFNTRGAQPVPEFASGNRSLMASEVTGAVGSVGLVGDSVAMSLYPGLAYAAANTSRNLAAATFPGCPVGEIEHVKVNGAPFSFARRCAEAVVRGQSRMVDLYDPHVVFWLSARDRFPIRLDDEVLTPGTKEWEEAAFADWDAVLERLTAGGARVVLILPFHRAGDDPFDCAGSDALSRRCAQPILSINSLRHEYTRWAARHADSVLVVNPDPVVCPASPCPSSAQGVALRSDPVHFTEEGARLVAQELIDSLPEGTWE